MGIEMNVWVFWGIGLLAGLVGGLCRTYLGSGDKKEESPPPKWIRIVSGGLSGTLIAGLASYFPAILHLPVPFLASVLFVVGFGGRDIIRMIYSQFFRLMTLWLEKKVNEIIRTEGRKAAQTESREIVRAEGEKMIDAKVKAAVAQQLDQSESTAEIDDT